MVAKVPDRLGAGGMQPERGRYIPVTIDVRDLAEPDLDCQSARKRGAATASIGFF